MTANDTLTDYQHWITKTSWYKGAGKEDTTELIYLTLGLTGESGEFADAIKKLHRQMGTVAWELAHQEDRLKIAYELSDILWYVTRTCEFFGITVEDLAILNMVKLFQRINSREESGLGKIKWPLTHIPYEDALKLTQRIEFQIIGRNATQSTDTVI